MWASTCRTVSGPRASNAADHARGRPHISLPEKCYSVTCTPVRPPTLATVATSSEGSIGFETWNQKACMKRSRPVLGAGKGAKRDRRQPATPRRPQRPHPSQQLIAIDIRHADVAQQHIRSFHFGRCHDVRIALLQHTLDQLPCILLVINHQNLDSGRIQSPPHRISAPSGAAVRHCPCSAEPQSAEGESRRWPRAPHPSLWLESCHRAAPRGALRSRDPDQVPSPLRRDVAPTTA